MHIYKHTHTHTHRLSSCQHTSTYYLYSCQWESKCYKMSGSYFSTLREPLIFLPFNCTFIDLMITSQMCLLYDSIKLANMMLTKIQTIMPLKHTHTHIYINIYLGPTFFPVLKRLKTPASWEFNSKLRNTLRNIGSCQFHDKIEIMDISLWDPQKYSPYLYYT